MLNRRRLLPNGDPMYGELRPKAPRSRDRFLKDEEIALLWRALDDPKVVYPFAAIVRMLLLTGCRLAEIARLEPPEVTKVTVGEVRDCPALSISDRTKMGRRHEVPLSPLAQEVMKEAREIEGCRWVFSITGRSYPPLSSSPTGPQLRGGRVGGRPPLLQAAALQELRAGHR
jgi:integrase